jgi:hypothetical protein
MLDLIGSFLRLSTAGALFTLEQMGNAALAPLDTQAALARLCRSLDAMSDTLASKLDPAKQSALASMTRAQAEAFRLAELAPGPETAGAIVAKTSGALAVALGAKRAAAA